MNLTRTFTPDQLDAIGVPFECGTEPADGYATELHREQIDTRRWVSVHELVFRAPDDGKAYRVTYEQGLTEHQDGLDPWDYQTSITATEVVQRPVTVQQWQDVAEPQPERPAEPTPDITVYELRTGAADDDRPDTIARYANTTAAALHGEAQYRAAHGYTVDLEWPQVGTDDAPVWRLMTVDDLDGEETPTDWHIVPVTVPAAYTPAGGEQA